MTTIVYSIEDDQFEWDEQKAESNRTKHGVSFAEAAQVFFDPGVVFVDASSNDEQRDAVIGYSFALRLVLVVYTERAKRTRIISARVATVYERKRYEKGAG